MTENGFCVTEHEMTPEEVKAVLGNYEKQYGMSSEEFYTKWKRGETYWVADSVDWSGLYAALRSLNGHKGNGVKL